MRECRYQHTCMLIPGPTPFDDIVVVSGGHDGVNVLKTCEAYVFSTVAHTEMLPSGTTISSAIHTNTASTMAATDASSSSDASVRQWRTYTDMLHARAGHTGVVLPERSWPGQNLFDHMKQERKLKAQLRRDRRDE